MILKTTITYKKTVYDITLDTLMKISSTVALNAPLKATLKYGGIKGDKGDAGTNGTDGASDEVQAFVCGEDISGGTAVGIKSDGKAYKYDPNDLTFYNLPSGIAAQSGSTGGTINVSLFGIVTDSGSGWAIGNDYYVGVNGLLVTAPQATLIIYNIASGIGTDKILINKQPIILTS